MSRVVPPLPTAVHGPLEALAQRYHLTTLPLHANEVVAAFLAYEGIYLILSPALSSLLVPQIYSRLSDRVKTNWNVRVVSFVQSSFICVLALRVILCDETRRTTDWSDRLWGYSVPGGTVQACAAGYFLWDAHVSVMHIQILGVGSLLHAVSALVITCIGFRPFANYYGMNFILYELSTPFLNIHWFLDKLGMTGSRLQLWNGICLMTVFFGCRLVWGSYQSFNLYSDAWSAWKSSITDECLENVLQAGKGAAPPSCSLAVPLWLLVLYLIGNTLLSALNVFWFGKMIQAITKRFTSESKPSKKAQ